eukprot:g15800.t1
MNELKKPPFPITREKAVDYFTAMVGDEDKSFYSAADDYVVSTVARLKCIDGAFKMSLEDEAALRAVIARQRRAGKFQHEQAPGILLEEIVEVGAFNSTFASAVAIGFLFGLRRRTILHHVKFGGSCDLTKAEDPAFDGDGYNSEDEVESSDTEVPAGAFGVADEDKNGFQHFAGDFKYNPKSRVFMLDLRGYILKSNAIKQVYVNCLCKADGLEDLCPHVCVPAIANDADWKNDFIDNVSEFFGHKRTHCMPQPLEQPSVEPQVADRTPAAVVAVQTPPQAVVPEAPRAVAVQTPVQTILPLRLLPAEVRVLQD